MQDNELLSNIIEWAEQDKNIVALIQTGSHTRNDGMVDEYSDYDLEIIAKDVSQLAVTDEWFKQFGKVWIHQAFDESQEYPSRLVVYEGGMKVDYTLSDENRVTDTNAQDLASLFQRGYKVLIDKTGIAKHLPAPTGDSSKKELPTYEEYLATVNEFWFEAYHIPKYLVRDELWVVKFRSWTMKEMLLKMLEWYAVTHSDKPVDVWHIGSHMKAWLEPELWQKLQAVYAHFDAQDSWAALLTEIELFRQVSKAVAEKLGYHYPSEVDKNISTYILSFENIVRKNK